MHDLNQLMLIKDKKYILKFTDQQIKYQFPSTSH